MNDEHLKTLAQVRAFLNGTQVVAFSLHSQQARCDFIRRSLIRLRYHRLSRPYKGLLLSFMTRVSGYSRVQVKRLAKTWLEHGKLRPRSRAGNGFTRNCTDADQRLLAKLDDQFSTSFLNVSLEYWIAVFCHPGDKNQRQGQASENLPLQSHDDTF